MTIYNLIEGYKRNNPKGHYFDSDTLKFFGESISNMQVLKKIVKIKDYNNEVHDCYVLSKISKDFNGQKFRNYAYFDINTFKQIDG